MSTCRKIQPPELVSPFVTPTANLPGYIKNEHYYVSADSRDTNESSASALRIRRNEVLGKGGFATVVAGTLFFTEGDSIEIAVKQIKYKETLWEKLLSAVKRGKETRTKQKTDVFDVEHELEVLRQVRTNAYTVMFFGNYKTRHNVCLLFEKCLPFTLGKFIFDKGRGESLKWDSPCSIPIALPLFIIGPICSALAWVHEKGYVHADVKPDNILFSTLGVPKLSDFGAAVKSERPISEYTSIVGTLRYMSPESLIQNKLTFKHDSWSLGIVCLDIINAVDSRIARLSNDRASLRAYYFDFLDNSKQDEFFSVVGVYDMRLYLRPYGNFIGRFVERLMVVSDENRVSCADLLEDNNFSTKVFKPWEGDFNLVKARVKPDFEACWKVIREFKVKQ